jgi:hypothetical protein
MKLWLNSLAQVIVVSTSVTFPEQNSHTLCHINP